VAIATLAIAPTPIAVPVVEVALPPKFNGERGQVVDFINACCLSSLKLRRVVIMVWLVFWTGLRQN